MSAVSKFPWSGHTTPTAWPIPEGVLPFDRRVLEGGEDVSFYQFGSVLVAVAAGDLLRLEVLTVVLEGKELPTNLLGFGATEARDEIRYTWCSLYLDHMQYQGHSPKELEIELFAIVDDDE